jgi:ribosome biogenesis protein UTP30
LAKRSPRRTTTHPPGLLSESGIHNVIGPPGLLSLSSFVSRANCADSFSAIRISTVGISNPTQTLENLLAAVPTAIAQIQGGWDNVLSIGIKTSTSVLLPVWSSPLEGRFDADANADADEDVDMDEKKKGKAKGKKRGAEVVETGSKKVKSAVQADKVEEVAPAKKAVKGQEGKEKVVKKKSSTVGSGGAAKRAKEAVLGRK